MTNEYIFFAGQRIARRDGSGNVYYYFQDALGSSHTITDATGHLCYDADFYLERVPSLVEMCGSGPKAI